MQYLKTAGCGLSWWDYKGCPLAGVMEHLETAMQQFSEYWSTSELWTKEASDDVLGLFHRLISRDCPPQQLLRKLCRAFRRTIRGPYRNAVL